MNSTEILNEIKKGDFDCAPVYESVIGQKYIFDLWVHSNAEHVFFHTAVMIVAGSDNWIESGPKKGDTICENGFDNVGAALRWVREQEDLKMREHYGDLTLIENFGV